MKFAAIQNCIDIIRGKKRSNLTRKINDFLILKDKSLDIEIPDDLVLHLGFNANCNCRCKFCTQGDQRYIEKELIDSDLIYKHLLPLYKKAKHLVPTQGEITCVKEGYEYLKWIDENYPQINISIESNGIAFNEKWCDLAVKNFMNVHFSVNAINNETFLRTVWGDVGGEKVFEKIEANIKNYISKLNEKGLRAFAPSVSCVLNSTNYYETAEFIKMALNWGCYKIHFYFDTIENNMHTGEIKDKEGFLHALKTLFEVERLLEGKVDFYFRLFMPYKNPEQIEKEVLNENIDELKEKYKEIYSLAEKFNLEELFLEKNKARHDNNKPEFTKCEDMNGVTWHRHAIGNKTVCRNPWNHLRIRANGFMEVCSWRGYREEFKIQDFIKNKKINWNDIFNGLHYKKIRKMFMNGCTSGCMQNCPALFEHEDI